MKVGDRTVPVAIHMPPHGVTVFESRHAPGFHTAVMRHRYLKVLAVLKGRGTLRFRGKAARFDAGDLMVLPPATPHQIEDDPHDPACLLGICVQRRWIQGQLQDLPCGVLQQSAAARHGVEGLLRRMLYEQSARRPGWPVLMQGLWLQLLAELIRRRPAASVGADHAGVAGVVAALQQEFIDPPALDVAAARAGLGRRRFTDLFRRQTGNSYLGHIRALRIRYAQQLLAGSAHSTTAIAFACGFNDLSTFYRAFAALVGCSPGKYRASVH